MKKIVIFIFVSCSISLSAFAQDYFFKSNSPFDENIKSPEDFLGYPIGSHHTRHDRLVAYFEYLSEASNKAKLQVYGETYEKRPLIILTISSKSNINNLDELKKEHLKLTDPTASSLDFTKQPVFINLGYGVHGNEPSSSEAAMLTAYTLIASQNTEVKNYLYILMKKTYKLF